MGENEKKSDDDDEILTHLSKKELMKIIQEAMKNKNFQEISPKESTALPEKKIESIEKKLESIGSEEAAIVDFSIVVSITAILGFVRHALAYANPKIPKEKWIEVIGLLGGRLNKEKKILFLEDVAAMGHGNSIHAEIENYDNYEVGRSELVKKGLFACGWYHSHPSYNLFLSNEDTATQTRYQKLWAPSIALVVDPELIDGTKYGFKIFRLDLKTKKYYEVPYSIKGAFDAGNLFEVLKVYETTSDKKQPLVEYDVSKSG